MTFGDVLRLITLGFFLDHGATLPQSDKGRVARQPESAIALEAFDFPQSDFLGSDVENYRKRVACLAYAGRHVSYRLLAVTCQRNRSR